MNNSRKLFTLAGILILIGSLAPGTFRVASSSGFWAMILAVSFSKTSDLNTADQYCFNNHGKIVGIQKEMHDSSVGWAYLTLAIQFLFWLPAILIIALLRINKDVLGWKGLLYGAPGFLIWIISEFSSPI